MDQRRDVIHIIKPESALRWHREMVGSKWTQERKNNGNLQCLTFRDWGMDRQMDTVFVMPDQVTGYGDRRYAKPGHWHKCDRILVESDCCRRSVWAIGEHNLHEYIECKPIEKRLDACRETDTLLYLIN